MNRRDSGAVFVEALVAAAIVAMILAATFRVIADTAARDRMAEARQGALLVAQSQLAAVGADIPLSEGRTSGLAGDLLWRVDIAPAGQFGDDNAAGSLWRVAVSVRPRAGGVPLIVLRACAWARTPTNDRANLETIGLPPCAPSTPGAARAVPSPRKRCRIHTSGSGAPRNTSPLGEGGARRNGGRVRGYGAGKLLSIFPRFAATFHVPIGEAVTPHPPTPKIGRGPLPLPAGEVFGGLPAGFALIEALASLVIVGMIALMLIQGVGTGRRVWERLDSRAAAGEAVEGAQAVLRGRIEQLYPATLYGGDQARVDIAGAAESLVFLAPPAESGRPGPLRRFRLSLTVGRDLDLSSISDVAAWNDARIDTQVLLTGVQQIDLAYFGAAPPDQTRRWRPTWTGQTLAPELVRVRLSFEPGDPRRWPDLIIRLRTTIDSSCVLSPTTGLCRGRG